MTDCRLGVGGGGGGEEWKSDWRLHALRSGSGHRGLVGEGDRGGRRVNGTVVEEDDTVTSAIGGGVGSGGFKSALGCGGTQVLGEGEAAPAPHPQKPHLTLQPDPRSRPGPRCPCENLGEDK